MPFTKQGIVKKSSVIFFKSPSNANSLIRNSIQFFLTLLHICTFDVNYFLLTFNAILKYHL